MDDYFRAWCKEDIVDILKKGGIGPEDINTVILRYATYFHTID